MENSTEVAAMDQAPVGDHIPFPRELVQSLLEESGFSRDRLSIREMRRLADLIEERLPGACFVRMEMGIPSLPPPPLAAEAETRALARGVHGRYAPFDGVPELKRAGARFFRAFLGIEVPERCVLPTCGAMQGGFIAQSLAGHMHADRDAILFLDPNFPVSKQQARFLGLKEERIDLYDHRGEKLLQAIEAKLQGGNIGGILWSSPNNPSWVCLTDEELAGIARLCDEHQVLAIEDQAYLGMDFRRDYSQPYEEPYVPSIARHGSTWVCLVSASKIFSYPGPRCALAFLSPGLATAKFPGLEQVFGTQSFLHAFAHGALYVTTAGVGHPAQYVLAELLESACDGTFDFLGATRVYADRCHEVRKIFLANGFEQVYDRDLDEPVGDGFYLTMCYPGMTGRELLWELLHYGISGITLESTGSVRTDGLRLCVSFVTPEQYATLEHRLSRFREEHPGLS